MPQTKETKNPQEKSDDCQFLRVEFFELPRSWHRKMQFLIIRLHLIVSMESSLVDRVWSTQ